MAIEPPQESKGDKLFGAGKAIVESLAPGGSLVAWLVELVWKPPLHARIQRWMEEVSVAINQLNRTAAELSANERFISNLTRASQLVMQNHSMLKLTALKNTVINSVEEPSYEESLQTVFLSYVDRFSDWHLRILKLFSDVNWMHDKKPLKRFGDAESATLNIIQDRFTKLKGQNDFIKLVLNDLRDGGLIRIDWDSVSVPALNRAISLPSLSKIGKDFLSFITDDSEKQ